MSFKKVLIRFGAVIAMGSGAFLAGALYVDAVERTLGRHIDQIK